MKITDLFRQQSVANAGNAQRSNSQNTQQQAGTPGQDDTVTISDTARNLAKLNSQISRVLEDDSVEQRAKVEGLKAKVANGEFSVSSTEVAASIVEFAKDNEF